LNEQDRRRSAISLDKFGIRYFEHYFQQERPAFHLEINQLLISEQLRIAIAAPRGHAKSTLIALIYVLWTSLTGQKPLTVIISDTARQANILLRNIKLELEENELLIADYGNQVGETWTQDDIILKSGVRILAKGAGAKVRGIRHGPHRPSLIIIDDLENDESVRSKDQRDKLKYWYAQAVENMLDPKTGRIVTIGTLLHPYSHMADLVEPTKWQAYSKHIYRALENDIALWPDRFDKPALDQIKKDIGSFAFQCEYMNNPVDEETKMFELDKLQYYETCDWKEMDIYAAIDPAISTKTRADYFVCITIGRQKDSGDIYILDIYRRRDTVDNHISAIIERYNKYQWTRLSIETVAFQEVLKKLIVDECARRGYYLPAVGLKNNTDKYLRIQKLQPMFENGQIFIKRNMQDFIEEYDCYPNVEHDDQLDCLEMCVRNLEQSFFCAVI